MNKFFGKKTEKKTKEIEQEKKESKENTGLSSFFVLASMETIKSILHKPQHERTKRDMQFEQNNIFNNLNLKNLTNHNILTFFFMLQKPIIAKKLHIEILLALTENNKFFKSYTEDGFTKVHKQCCRRIQYLEREKDEILFNAGDDPDHFYIILEGKVAVFIELVIGGISELRQVATLSSGTGFGEYALLRDEKRSAMIKTTQKSSFAILNKTDYKLIFQQVEEEKMEKRLYIAQSSSIKHLLDEKTIAVLYQKCFSKKFSRGEHVFQQNDECLAVFIVNQGKFAIYQDRMDEDEQKRQKQEENEYDLQEEIRDMRKQESTLHGFFIKKSKYKLKKTKISTLEQGELFGEEDILLNQKRSYTVQCESDQGEVLVLNYNHFYKIFLRNKANQQHLINRVQKKLFICKSQQQNLDEQIKKYRSFMIRDVEFNHQKMKSLGEIQFQKEISTFVQLKPPKIDKKLLLQKLNEHKKLPTERQSLIETKFMQNFVNKSPYDTIMQQKTKTALNLSAFKIGQQEIESNRLDEIFKKRNPLLQGFHETLQSKFRLNKDLSALLDLKNHMEQPEIQLMDTDHIKEEIERSKISNLTKVHQKFNISRFDKLMNQNYQSNIQTSQNSILSNINKSLSHMISPKSSTSNPLSPKIQTNDYFLQKISNNISQQSSIITQQKEKKHTQYTSTDEDLLKKQAKTDIGLGEGQLSKTSYQFLPFSPRQKKRQHQRNSTMGHLNQLNKLLSPINTLQQ